MNAQAQGALNRYKAVQIRTGSKGELVVQLYDGMLRFIAEAEQAMKAGDPARTGERIGRCQAILEMLVQTLDKRHAPELCEQLEGIYGFCLQHLLQANIKRNPAMLSEVSEILRPLRDAWSEVIRKAPT